VQHPSRPIAPAGAVLKSQSGTQFSIRNSAGINDPEEPDKYDNTEVKSTGQLFTAATQHLTPAVVKYKNLKKK
jgi:hypothetical protein